MPSTVEHRETTTAANTATKAASATNEKPAVIATRQRCEAEGVGLSHYILMDRKAEK